ncbi:MAG: hypothetical protein H6712_26115 [Myxococcales bacterium]|nr:hypothetical protein [Myxococcales bacterium]MCB9717351.1 hypothetical protein [Myxococcales bacterium]
MRFRAMKLFVPVLVALGLAGCNAYRLDPPAGFAEVYKEDDGAHMKANNDVGLRVHVFDNFRGGTLAFWSQDLVDKLGTRGYTLVGQTPTASKNGVAGTRFDFDYTPVGKSESPRFYTVVLFVTDEHRVVLGLAGREEHESRYSSEIDAIVGDLKVRGCKVASKVCKGPQPDKLSTPVPEIPGGGEPAKAEAAKAEPSKAKPEPATAEAEPSKAEG